MIFEKKKIIFQLFYVVIYLKHGSEIFFQFQNPTAAMYSYYVFQLSLQILDHGSHDQRQWKFDF